MIQLPKSAMSVRDETSDGIHTSPAPKPRRLRNEILERGSVKRRTSAEHRYGMMVRESIEILRGGEHNYCEDDTGDISIGHENQALVVSSPDESGLEEGIKMCQQALVILTAELRLGRLGPGFARYRLVE